MDGLKAFSHLCDVVPDWKERLKALSYTVNERHLEFTRLSRTASGAASLHRKRTGSTESLRPDDEAPSPGTGHDRSGFPSPPMRVEVNPDAKNLFQEYRLQAKRKRNSGSITSNVSGPPRSRMSIIVYYDSAIQESFEIMVRSIAGARNTLRKGKTAASMKARMAGMAMEESPFEGNRTTFSMRDPKIPRLTRSGTPGSVYNAEPFEQIDKELETAQTLCEIGAHQFLRDGTCQNEIAGAHERIDGVLTIAKEQRALYEQEAKAEAELDAQRDGTMRERPKRPRMSNIPTVDPGMEGILAIDESYNDTKIPMVDPAVALDHSLAVDPSVAVDSSIAVDPMVTADSGIAVDPSFSADSVAVEPSVAVDSLAVDPAVAADSGIAIDPALSPDSSIAVDPKLANMDLLAVDSDITVDPSVAVDHGSAVESGAIEIDSHPTFGASPKVGTYHYSTGPIEVDDHDGGSFHIDLSSFRRTRGM